MLTAIETFVRSQIVVSQNQKITIELKAGRGENGYSAILDIVPSKATTRSTPAPGAVNTPTKAAITETPEDRKEPSDEVEAKRKAAAEAASKTARKSAFTLKDEEPEAEEVTAEAEDKPAPKAGTIFSKVKEA